KNIAWASSPLKNIPLKNIDLTTSPLKNIPLKNIAFADAPLKNIPLKNIDLAASGLGGLPLGAIAWDVAPLGATNLDLLDLADSPLGAILLAATANPANIDACGATCPAGETLAQADANHEILASATLADIGAAGFGATTLADLLSGSALALSLGDLRLDLAGPGAPSVTIAQLEAALTGSPAPVILVGDLRLDEAVGVDTLVLDDLSGFLVDPATFAPYLLGDLGTYTDLAGHDITLGELGIWTDNTGADITLGELAQYLDDSVSLADVLLGLVPPSQFPFENFPIASLGLNEPGRSIIQPPSGTMGAAVGCGATGTSIGAGYVADLPTCFSVNVQAPNDGSGSSTDPVTIDAILPAGAVFLSVKVTGINEGWTVSTDPDGRT
ncbi:MAG: hypothetical protein ACRDGQ_10325, partial [Candidatus Limnocylindrales bacterium]